MELFQEFLSSLLKTSPIIGLLMLAIWYFYKENIELKKDVKELNKFIQDENVKNIQILSSISKTLDKVVEQNDDNIDDLKEWLDLKLKEKK